MNNSTSLLKSHSLWLSKYMMENGFSSSKAIYSPNSSATNHQFHILKCPNYCVWVNRVTGFKYRYTVHHGECVKFLQKGYHRMRKLFLLTDLGFLALPLISCFAQNTQQLWANMLLSLLHWELQVLCKL